MLLIGFSVQAQSLDQLLAKLDRASASFTGAKADIRRAIYTSSIHETDIDVGTILVRRSAPGKVEFRIDFTGDNASSFVVRGQTAEQYHPQINQIDYGDIKKYRGIVQTLMALGFGMSGQDLKTSYAIANLRRDTIAGQPTTAVDLTPKSTDLADQIHLQKVELWIADSTSAPVKEKVYLRDGDTWTIEYSNLQINPKIAGNAFDLPKNAKRVKH
jgi:outer membrane lipoprotein-sorting protein